MLSTAALAVILLAAPQSGRAGTSSAATADRRGNDVLRRREGLVFSVTGAPRLGVLLAGGARVMQPVGFGAGLQFSLHGLHVGPVRFGGSLSLGHTRYLQRRTLTANTDGTPQEITRYAALSHTDFTLGPSVQVVLGPVFLQGDFGAGLGISHFVRPLGPFSADEEDHSDVTAAIRGVGSLGIPIRNNHAVLVGAGVHRYFSRLQVAAEPPPQPGAQAVPDTNPFDLMVEIHLGYHFSF